MSNKYLCPTSECRNKMQRLIKPDNSVYFHCSRCGNDYDYYYKLPDSDSDEERSYRLEQAKSLYHSGGDFW